MSLFETTHHEEVISLEKWDDTVVALERNAGFSIRRHTYQYCLVPSDSYKTRTHCILTTRTSKFDILVRLKPNEFGDVVVFHKDVRDDTFQSVRPNEQFLFSGPICEEWILVFRKNYVTRPRDLGFTHILRSVPPDFFSIEVKLHVITKLASGSVGKPITRDALGVLLQDDLGFEAVKSPLQHCLNLAWKEINAQLPKTAAFQEAVTYLLEAELSNNLAKAYSASGGIAKSNLQIECAILEAHVAILKDSLQPLADTKDKVSSSLNDLQHWESQLALSISELQSTFDKQIKVLSATETNTSILKNWLEACDGFTIQDAKVTMGRSFQSCKDKLDALAKRAKSEHDSLTLLVMEAEDKVRETRQLEKQAKQSQNTLIITTLGGVAQTAAGQGHKGAIATMATIKEIGSHISGEKRPEQLGETAKGASVKPIEIIPQNDDDVS